MTDPANQNATIEEDEAHWHQLGIEAARAGLSVRDCPLLQSTLVLELHTGDVHRWSSTILAWEEGYRTEWERLHPTTNDDPAERPTRP